MDTTGIARNQVYLSGKAQGTGKSKGLKDIHRAAWLHLLKTGERKSAVEIAADLGQSSDKVRNALVTLFYGDSVRRYPVPGRLVQSNYGVTEDCVAPKSVTVKDLSEAFRK